jgi:hypothetical protein
MAVRNWTSLMETARPQLSNPANGNAMNGEAEHGCAHLGGAMQKSLR